jgi:formylglycine-generating enzyme required for sulfatase activity
MGARDDEPAQDDERPAHDVEIDGFACAVYPVTEAEYAAFLLATGHAPPREWAGVHEGSPLPVVGVSWHDAAAYCAWLGDGWRLPSEAEWEWAARGGLTGARYPWGDAIPAWVPNGARGPLPGPWPVALGEPNGFGLYGIGGNIHEWCADWHAADYYARSPMTNPRGPEHGTRRASRGGAWRHAITVSRCAQRSKIPPDYRYTDYGFRIVRTLRTGT